MNDIKEVDVVVVDAGNAAMCANYPSGTGLVSGAVFGRIAGTEAAQHAKRSTAASVDPR